MGTTKFAAGTATRFGRRIAITIPEYLWHFLKKEALENNRSISSQVVHFLESYVPPKERKIFEREGVEWMEGR